MTYPTSLGTSISVYGLVSPGGTGNTPSSFYSVDGQNSKTYTASPTSSTQSQVLFYNSGTLPNGPHNLVLINLVELDYLWIDYFEITTSNDSPAAATTAAATAPPSSGQVTTSAPPVQTTKVVTQILTSLVTESSTTKLSVVTTVKSDVIQVSSASSTNNDASPSGIPVVDTGASNAPENNAPVGAIVGGIMGGLAVIILAMFLFVLLKRKRRTGNIDDESNRMSPTTGQSASGKCFTRGDDL